MAPPKKPRKPTGASGKEYSSLGFAGAVVVALAAAAFVWFKSANDVEQATSASSAANADSKAAGLGPQTMQAQQPLLDRLLQLLQEVEEFKGEEHKAERQTVSARVEKELNDIEAKLKSDSSVDQQSAALISVVRSALTADRDGWKDEDWNDESLVKQHGFVTYASQTYWDEAYKDNKYGDSYDWYGAWSEKGTAGKSLGDNVRPLLAKDSKMLMLGCGNSNMSVLMHEEGYRDIMNVDISEPVIERMKASYGHIQGLSWHAMDASALKVEDASFDTVIEKGLFDALFAGTGALTESVLKEIRRVLRPGGSLISITFSGERLRSILSPDKAESEDAEVSGHGLSCSVKGQIQYSKAKSTHKDKGEGQTFFIYKCDRS